MNGVTGRSPHRSGGGSPQIQGRGFGVKIFNCFSSFNFLFGKMKKKKVIGFPPSFVVHIQYFRFLTCVFLPIYVFSAYLWSVYPVPGTEDTSVNKRITIFVLFELLS